MSTRYDTNHKAAVMVMLERNRGDVRATSLQTGVPVNTLRDWQHDIFPYLSSSDTPAARQLAEIPVFESDLETLAFIRQNILGELSRLSASLQYDSGFSTPYQRALVMSQLMDRLLKLDVHLQPYMEEEEEIITYERAYPRPERDEGDYDPPA